MECIECGGETVIVKGDHRFIESGLESVVLKGVEFVKCEQCGSKELMLPHMDELMRLIGLALIWKPCKLRGEDVRYLRKYVGLSANEFSKLLDLDPTTLSKWENDHQQIGAANDRLIRVVTLAMSDDHLRELHEQFVRLVKERFPAIDDTCDNRMMDLDAENMSYAYA